MTTTVLTARALLLDMDGTLVNSDAAVERIWRRWALDHGLDPDEALKIVHGRQGYATMAVLLPNRPMEDNYADNREMLALETADTEGVVPVPGAPAFMAAIEALPHALVTSADERLAQARITAAGLRMPPQQRGQHGPGPASDIDDGADRVPSVAELDVIVGDAVPGRSHERVELDRKSVV